MLPDRDLEYTRVLRLERAGQDMRENWVICHIGLDECMFK